MKSLVASVSSVLAIGVLVSLGTQPSEFSAVPMASVGQPEPTHGVSTAQPKLPPDPMMLVAGGGVAENGATVVSSMLDIDSLVPEEAPGEDTTVLTVPSVVPTAPIPSVTPSTTSASSGTLLSMPLEGRKTSRFGMRFHPIRHVWKLHSGLDLAAPCGTPVGAAAAGTVVKAGWAGGNGTQVKIDHGTIAGRKVVTTYNHLSAIGVSVGQTVAVNQGVGRVGNTGFSTGCHLHFEVIADGAFTNPEPWLSGGSVVVDTAAMVAGRPGPSNPTLPPLPGTTPPLLSQVPSSSASAPTATATSATPTVTPPTVTPTPSVTPAQSASVPPSSSASPTLNPIGSATPSVTPTTAGPVTSPTPTPTATAPVVSPTTTSTPTKDASTPVTATSAPVTPTSTPVTTTSVPVTTTSVPVTTTSVPVTTTTVPVTTTTSAPPSATKTEPTGAAPIDEESTPQE